MIELKVRKFGNSLGVILPREVIQRLRTAEGDHILLIETADGGVKLAPREEEFEEQMRIAEEGMSRYRNTLRVLAK